ncbi:MAG: hypothetical protein FVQ77_05070 [Cytophagales bacterium]|nr:hypothetical protein [Cytophagales bacterium]
MRHDPAYQKDYRQKYYTLITEAAITVPALKEGEKARDSVLFAGFYPPGSMGQPEAWVPMLTYEMNSISFSFAAPFYERSNALQYSYLLMGFDKNWSAWSKKTNKEYTNLPPGKYTYYVKAKNIYHHESEVGEYRFRILPPWWLTWWFYALQGGVLIGLFCIILILRGTGEKRQKLIKVLAYMFIFLVLEYAQNYTEEALASYITGIVLLKIVLNVVIGALLIPFEGFVLRIARATAKLKTKTQRGFGVKMLTKRVENTIVKKARKENTYEIAKNMLGQNIDMKVIAQVTRLSLAKVNGLM